MPDWTEGSYVRVYRSLQADRPAVWGDKALLGWYVTLLDVAQGVYPAAAPLPRDIPDETVAALVEAGAIDPEGTSRYRVSGLDRLRSAMTSRGYRGGVARAAVAARDAGGRMLAADAGRTNGAAGSSTLARTLDTQRPVGTLVDQRASDKSREDDPPALHSAGGIVSSEAEPPAGAPARGGRYGPFTGPCDDPKGHAASHRYIQGVGWRCLVCTEATRAEGPSFSDRVPRPGTTKAKPDDRPF